MKEIDKLRKKIDKIDLEILSLLNVRSELAEHIGKEKKSKNLFRPERQAFILKRLLKNKISNVKPDFILAFWRSIFFSQIDIQGGIELIILENISDIHKINIYDYFSHDVKISTVKNIKKGIEKIKSEKNTFMILPYPSDRKQSDWWIREEMDNVYIINTLPFFLKKDKKPNLVVISRYKPEINEDSCFLYISKNLIKDSNLSLEAKCSNNFLYISNNLIINRNIKLFGVFPKHYEIKK